MLMSGEEVLQNALHLTISMGRQKLSNNNNLMLNK